MRSLISRAIFVLIAGFLLAPCWAVFCQAPGAASKSPSTPPAIDEAVPPPSDNYTLGPDSLAASSAPAGAIFKFEMSDSKIFPGTTRTITVYVPAAYKADKPACVYVGLDELGFNAPVVFDNLIAQHAMPVTIGIGVSSGTVESAHAPDDPRFDRSSEFDSLDGRLGKFLLEEVIPAVQKHTTLDGRSIRLSQDPNDRAIGGGSTGGIGAFTVAWEHPDAFRRVFSAIGTYVGMRGGEQYYVLVRKTEPRPMRVFMQDGVHDEWGGGPEMGDWWMSNLSMNRALEFAGYDVRHVWGTGTHNGNQAASILPDAMRWLWRDWPTPVTAGKPGNPVLQAILDPGQGWEVAAEGCSFVTDLAAKPQGEVFYQSGADQKISNAPTSGGPIQCKRSDHTASFAFGPAGKLYVARAGGGVEVLTHPGGKNASAVLASDLRVEDFTVRSNGAIYAMVKGSGDSSELWLISPDGKSELLDEDLKDASGVAATADGLWLFVTQSRSRAGLSYRVRTDGTVDSREPFYKFYAPSEADESGAAQIAMDQDGRPYVATAMGIQVFDRNGRVTAILPLPGNAPARGIAFGGAKFDTLYVAAGDKLYKRQLRVAGVPPWGDPVKLPPWGAG